MAWMKEEKMSEALGKGSFSVVEVSGQFYAILTGNDGRRVSTDGPYPEDWQAMSMSRLREVD